MRFLILALVGCFAVVPTRAQDTLGQFTLKMSTYFISSAPSEVTVRFKPDRQDSVPKTIYVYFLDTQSPKIKAKDWTGVALPHTMFFNYRYESEPLVVDSSGWMTYTLDVNVICPPKTKQAASKVAVLIEVINAGNYQTDPIRVDRKVFTNAFVVYRNP